MAWLRELAPVASREADHDAMDGAKFREKPIRSHDGFMHRISGIHYLVLNINLMRCLSSN